MKDGIPYAESGLCAPFLKETVIFGEMADSRSGASNVPEEWEHVRKQESCQRAPASHRQDPAASMKGQDSPD